MAFIVASSGVPETGGDGFTSLGDSADLTAFAELADVGSCGLAGRVPAGDSWNARHALLTRYLGAGRGRLGRGGRVAILHCGRPALVSW